MNTIVEKCICSVVQKQGIQDFAGIAVLTLFQYERHIGFKVDNFTDKHNMHSKNQSLIDFELFRVAL